MKHRIPALLRRPGTIRLSLLLLTICCSAAGAAAPPCHPPILPGAWRVRTLDARTTMTGIINQAGVSGTIDAEYITEALPGATNEFRVDCAGQITGVGSDQFSGEYLAVFTAMGISTAVHSVESGFERYTYTGTVVIGPNGLPRLQIQGTVTSGSQTTTVTSESVSTTTTEDLAGTTFADDLPVQSYDPNTGVLLIDFSQGRYFQQKQAEVDALTGGTLLDVLYSGEISYENTEPAVLSVTPQFQQFFLKSIPANNEITATVNWRNAGPNRVVRFVYGAQNQPVTPNGNTAKFTFDMGDAATAVTVTAEADGKVSDPFVLELTKVDLPPWAASAGITGADGVLYNGQLDWPVTPTVSQSFGNLPLVGGLWGFLGSINNKLEVKAHSQGAPPGAGRLEGDYNFGLPFTGSQVTFRLRGTAETTLSASDLELSGHGSARIATFTVDKTVSVLDLIPGASATVCSVSDELCDFVKGMGITGTLTFNLDGGGDFESTGSEVEWTTGEAIGTARAEVLIIFVPPPLDTFVSLTLEGGGTACLTLQLYPDIAVRDFGAQLDFTASASALSIASVSVQKVWPLAGGCGGGASGPARSAARSAKDAGFALPRDGHPSITVGPAGWHALAWSEALGHPRPSGEILLSLNDGSGWTSPINITDDGLANLAPDVAFDHQGRVIVAWQRNATPELPADLNQLSDIARGFEIAYAIVTATNGEIVASGTLTSNTELDFGPRLAVGGDGSVLLAWQRTSGDSFGGTPAAPASIWSSFLNGTTWDTPQLVAGNLIGIYGWRAALRTGQQGVLALTLAQGGVHTNAAMREIYAAPLTGGVWQPLVRVTVNSEPDWAPQVTYLPDGRLALGWLRNGNVWGLIGNLNTPAALWIQGNELIGPGFGHGRLLVDGGQLIALWPAANDLYFARVPITVALHGPKSGSPATPALLRRTPGEVESAFAAEPDGAGGLRLSSITASVVPGDIPSLESTSQLRTEAVPLALAAPRLIEVQPLAEGLVMLRWESVPGVIYSVQASEDLVRWDEVAEQTAAEAETSLVLPPFRVGPNLFYRLGAR